MLVAIVVNCPNKFLNLIRFDQPKNRLLLRFYKTYLEFVPTVLFFFSRVTARHLSPGGHCLVVILSLRHSRPLHCKHRGPFSIAASWRYLSSVHTQHSVPGCKRPPEDELVTSFRTCPTSRHTCSQEYSLVSSAPFASKMVSFNAEKQTSRPWNFALRFLANGYICPSFDIL